VKGEIKELELILSPRIYVSIKSVLHLSSVVSPKIRKYLVVFRPIHKNSVPLIRLLLLIREEKNELKEILFFA